MEQFSIPGAGGIIVKDIDGEKNILLQTRVKPFALWEDGLLEIPAGKIRAFESIFETLKREIKEETGLDVVEIVGENASLIYNGNHYKVLNFMPFSCAQNIEGKYPIMVFVFICNVEGELVHATEESKDYRWTSLSQIETMIEKNPERFYPMHVDTLKKYVLSCRYAKTVSCSYVLLTFFFLLTCLKVP